MEESTKPRKGRAPAPEHLQGIGVGFAVPRWMYDWMKDNNIDKRTEFMDHMTTKYNLTPPC